MGGRLRLGDLIDDEDDNEIDLEDAYDAGEFDKEADIEDLDEEVNVEDLI